MHQNKFKLTAKRKVLKFLIVLLIKMISLIYDDIRGGAENVRSQGGSTCI